MHPVTEMETKVSAIPSRRSGRRSRISIPDRTSSLSHKPRKSRLQNPDSVSFHNQRCKLHFSIDELLASNRGTPPPRYSEATSRPYTGQSPNINTAISEKNTTPVFDLSSPSALLSYSSPPIRRGSGYSESQLRATRPAYDTTMSWTSEETRRREYEKIDRAHTGWRGFVNNILPRSWKCGRRDFFRGEDDGDSVRRFRVSLPEKPEKPAKQGYRWACF